MLLLPLDVDPVVAVLATFRVGLIFDTIPGFKSLIYKQQNPPQMQLWYRGTFFLKASKVSQKQNVWVIFFLKYRTLTYLN